MNEGLLLFAASLLLGLLALAATAFGGSALVTIGGIYRKKRTIQRSGDDPLPALPRNRAERRAQARQIRRRG